MDVQELREKYRVDPRPASKNYCIIQAEDELAAIGMVIGADVGRARAFTATGARHLADERVLVGLAYYAEIPAVIIDVQRVGPSTGMPTRTQQGDIMRAPTRRTATPARLPVPGEPGECFHMAAQAFDLAERLQTPVFVLPDLDIGMNDWMCRSSKWDDDYQPDRGKVLSKEPTREDREVHAATRPRRRRYPARTSPACTRRARSSRAARATTQLRHLHRDATEYQIVLDRPAAGKFHTAAKLVPEPRSSRTWERGRRSSRSAAATASSARRRHPEDEAA